MVVELERTVPTRAERLPFFFAWNCGDYESFEREAREEPEIDELIPVERLDGGVLYHVRWGRYVDELVEGITDADATLVEAIGNDSEWRFEIRFPTNESISGFQRYLRERGIELGVDRIKTEVELESDRSYGLTEPQRDALVTAFRGGYFDEPRRLTLDELATDLGVSSAAASGRLRRATRRLIANTLAVTGGNRASRQRG